MERQDRNQVCLKVALDSEIYNHFSSFSRVDITTDQPAIQGYTANWVETPRKAVHGGPSLNYTKWSAVALEQQGYVDAINTPEWHINQICKSPVSYSS